MNIINNNMSKNISEFIPELLPIEKSFYDQINSVKSTIIKIFVNRNFINKENEEKYIKNLINDDNEDMEYVIKLDNSKNYNSEIKNKKIIIKFFDYKITSINKSSPIGEFITKHNNEYTFIIVDDINSKSENTLTDYSDNIEIFKFNNLQFNIIDHDLVPKHIVLNEEESKNVMETYRAKKRDMILIRTNDPIAKYYKMKSNDVVKIIRDSTMTCDSVSYRLIIKSKDTRAKT